MFEKIISLDNLFLAWKEFRKGKGIKKDVLLFENKLEQNILELHINLKDGTYKHAPYEGFFITDPKLRHVHKATVRDRVLHHAIFKVLNPIFEPRFISTSFSCQVGKGSHKGVKTVTKILRKVSKNNTVTCYAVKCDVRKFFDSINHETLLTVLRRDIKDQRTFNLLTELIMSYPQKTEKAELEREREREREREYFRFLRQLKEYRLAI